MDTKNVHPPVELAQAKVIRKALDDVKNGADIWGYGDAKRYRELAALGLVEITEAMMAPEDGAKRQPYFGCIITPLGRNVLIASKPKRARKVASHG